MKRVFFLQVVIFSTLILAVTNAFCAPVVTFSCLPNSEDNLAGYIIYYGTSTRNYEFSCDCGNPAFVDGRVNCVVDDLEDDTLYYFAIVAYDDTNNESDYSHELTYMTPPTEPNTAFPVRIGYLNDDQIQDTVLFWADGVYAIYGSDTVTESPIIISTGFTSNDGWDPETDIVDVIDVDEDGQMDIIGFDRCALDDLVVAYGIDGYSFEYPIQEDATLLIDGSLPSYDMEGCVGDPDDFVLF